jgi:ubiquinone/menaquinone biosynthesis C-methylase UbiE
MRWSIPALLLLSTSGWGQVATEANRDYQTREGRAKMIGILESPNRLANLRTAELVRALEVRPGQTVVDLGTGTGTLLPDLSRVVGPKGRVIAEDIHPDFLDRARKRAATLPNVEFVLGTETDPKLPAGATDLVVVLDAYHHFNYPEQMLEAIRQSLRPGGRLAIVEYYKKRGAMEVNPDLALTHIRAGVDQVVQEVEAAGYKLMWRREHSPGRQYIVMFGTR